MVDGTVCACYNSMEIPMQRTVCIACQQIIRRPVDHANCPGATDSWFLNVEEFVPKDREITREIKIPEYVKQNNK